MPFRVRGMWRAYYMLTKPGIVYGNLFTVLAGFLFASRLHIEPVLLISVLAGMAFIIAASCVFNNVIDRDVDAKMERTKDRAVVTGVVSVGRALIYGSILGMLGVVTLLFHVNVRTLGVALVGTVVYVLIYTYSKRVTRIHTLIGSISGAVPIVAGYSAYTNSIDTAAIILFFIMVLWQMPHFYAIALYRAHEYAAAGIPLLPSIKGAYITKVVITVYIVAFVCAETTLTLLGYTGFSYLALVLFFGVAWLLKALRGFRALDDVQWGKSVFFFSLNVLLAFCGGIAFGTLLP